MRKVLLFFVSGGYLFLMSCHYKIVSTDKNIVSLDSVCIDKTYFFGNKIKYCCNLQINFIYPKSNSKALQNIFIEKVLGKSFIDLTPQQAVENFTKQYIKLFKTFEKEYSNFSKEEYGKYSSKAGYIYYLQLRNNISYNQNDLISFSVESTSYEGGAHPSRSIYGYVIDLATNQLITENLFAGEDFVKNISNVLIKKIIENINVKDEEALEDLGYNLSYILPNNNFTINPKGVTYYFNEYEIAAYFVGITKVFIPYDEFSIYIMKTSPLSVLAE